MNKFSTMKKAASNALKSGAMVAMMAVSQNALAQNIDDSKGANNEPKTEVKTTTSNNHFHRATDKNNPGKYINSPKMQEVHDFVFGLGILTEDEKKDFNKMREDKLVRHEKRKHYAGEIQEIYEYTDVDTMQKAVLIVGLLDPKGETPLGGQAKKIISENPILGITNESNENSIKLDRMTSEEIHKKREKATKENEKATKENEKAHERLDKAIAKNEKATKENEKAHERFKIIEMVESVTKKD